ncbi:MAG: IS30 family transposase [uncultured Thiotrichaceae bacterium]|uniref:IS30 family transposase n=1 Tax=uncultured Thiotrichaceae bacterium TaxID=298394 RepID=A0A6S6TJ51_9GAMM|nr:MAG: IS30 family transposase [uncultured Thiotrichaceae bacterium]
MITRGLNENTNGLLRQYWPKSTNFKEVPLTEVEAVIIQLNDRPRKELSYKTPANKMAEYMAEYMAKEVA